MEEFNIDTDSQRLKELVSEYNSDFFVAEIAHLITTIQAPRIPFQPFVGLDSPLIQLTYLASLNVSSDSALGNRSTINYKDWVEIVKYSIRIKAGYYDALLPDKSEDEIEHYEKYKIAMPVFIDFFNTGPLNFEEQEIERIQYLFTSFNTEIKNYFGLDVDDLINIYNLIDLTFLHNRDKPFRLIAQDEETKQFWEQIGKENLHPKDWKYSGSNKNIIELIQCFQNSSKQFIISEAQINQKYNNQKIKTFLSLFSISRENRDYIFYTSPNLLMQNPLYNCGNGEYIIVDMKQLIHAIQKKLTSYCITLDNSGERFYRKRGMYLQEKTKSILEDYFDNKAFIFNEYQTSVNGDGQDILLLYKGFVLIIETKAGKEPEPHRNPNIKESFKVITRYFKKNIQSGYNQTYRVKKLFNNNTDFNVIQDNGTVKQFVRTRKYHSIFPIIITLGKFYEVQINLNHLLELEPADQEYPLSICIDDFEVLLLTLKKMKFSLHDFIKFFNFRQKLQGRVECNDELEIWADFIQRKKFTIPNNPKIHYRPSIYGADLYDDLYESGLGFKNEKFLDDKQTRRTISFRNFIKKHYVQHGQ